jgi:hypothetical protein
MAVQMEDRFTVGAAKDFDVFPLNVANACAEGFGNGFFSSPARGERVDPITNFGDFAIGEDAVEETVTVFLECFLKTRDFDEVNTGAEIHNSILSMFSGFVELKFMSLP